MNREEVNGLFSELDLLEYHTKELMDSSDYINTSVVLGAEQVCANNIVDKANLRKVQKSTLQTLSDLLANTYGPMGSNTIILKGNSKETLVTEYSKDGNKVLKNASFSDPIEMSIQSQIVDVTDFTDKHVGDGTTSATLLSNAIFKRLCELETDLSPYEIIREFKNVVNKIQGTIYSMKQETTLKEIYDICMISTNGNMDVSNIITSIYNEFGLNVYIDVAISNNEEDKIRVFDGLTLDEGYSDPAYINTKSGKCKLSKPKVYAFNDPVDTPDMVMLLETIVNKNIVEPVVNRDYDQMVPTVIISPKISRDASPIIEQLVDQLYQFKENEISTKPPIVIVTNLLGGNMDKYYDIAKLCGCKMIRKYIDPKLLEKDIASGVAPTQDNIDDFAGSCELFEADGSDSKFINPYDMFIHDDDGLYKVDEEGNYIKSVTYSNLLQFVKDALDNAIDNSEDDNTIGKLRKRLQSLQSNYVEYMVGGISIADRDATKDLVQDAIKNCRSACEDGYGYAANFEGFRAAITQYNFLKDDPDSEKEVSILKIIINAYKDIINILYSTYYSPLEAESKIMDSIANDMPINLSTGEFDGKVLSSIQTDIKILDAISKIITMMFTANQCLVQAPQVNKYC